MNISNLFIIRIYEIIWKISFKCIETDCNIINVLKYYSIEVFNLE